MTFSYSNAGYIIVGAILERVSGKQWETLIRDRLFTPLKMTSAGFGPPSKSNQTDQPWGHLNRGGNFVPHFRRQPGTVRAGRGPSIAQSPITCGLRPMQHWHSPRRFVKRRIR